MEINNGFTRYSDDFLECDLVGVLLDIVILKNEFGIRFADGRQSLCHLKPMQIRLDGSLQQRYYLILSVFLAVRIIRLVLKCTELYLFTSFVIRFTMFF